ncbi:MAG: thiol:disulfide interchange protein DsbA/DsbL [Gammaproteobacteria bacterium]
MNKGVFRTVKLLLPFCLMHVLSACTGQPTHLERPAFQEGLHFHKLTPAQPVATEDGRVEIVEVFFYACPHCYELEPKISNWLKDKKDRVNFRRMPAIMGPTWVVQAKAFYVAEKLGIQEKIHPALLNAIHKEGKQFYNEYTLMAFFIDQGVSEQDFIEAYNSPEVAAKLSQARVMTVNYGLKGVPAMIINGRYKTAQYFTGTQEKMLDVVDSLIDLEIKRISGE